MSNTVCPLASLACSGAHAKAGSEGSIDTEEPDAQCKDLVVPPGKVLHREGGSEKFLL